MAELGCHYYKLAYLLARLDAPRWNRHDDVKPCAESASHSAGVVLRSEGQDIEIYTAVCDAHDQLAQTIPGHTRSNRIRHPKPDPSR